MWYGAAPLSCFECLRETGSVRWVIKTEIKRPLDEDGKCCTAIWAVSGGFGSQLTFLAEVVWVKDLTNRIRIVFFLS